MFFTSFHHLLTLVRYLRLQDFIDACTLLRHMWKDGESLPNCARAFCLFAINALILGVNQGLSVLCIRDTLMVNYLSIAADRI